MGDRGQDILAPLLGLLLLDLLYSLGQSLLLYLLVVLVQGRVLSLLEIHFFSELKQEYSINKMIERRPFPTRTFISLNSRSKRHSSLPYLFPPRRKCKIALLSASELEQLLEYLPLIDLARLQQALSSNPKTKEGAKTIINYIARHQRIYSYVELKEFMGYIILRKRKLTKWWGYDKNQQRNDIERISWDVDRTNVWFCRSKEQIEGMRSYVRTVLTRLCGQESRYGYVQGFHCLIKAMYESTFTEQEAYLLGSYFLKEMKLGKYYENRQERMRELCYVLDVYVFNSLPEVHFYLKRQELTAQCYAIGWFITLFSQGLPLAVLNRLWTLFMLKGWKVIIKFAVALLCLFQQEILSKPESELPQYLSSLQLRLSYSKERILWQLYSSIKVTNKMIAYLAKHMKSLEYDREISIMQLKQMRESNVNYGQLESNEVFPSYFSVGMCCQKIEPSPFPYCTDY